MAAADRNPLKWFTSGDDFFSAARLAIESARESVRLEVYIYAASPLGRRVREHLVRAARRGLSVRVMVDAVGSLELADRFWQPLREAGGQVRWFNPLSLRGFALRDHRKLLVCDGSTAFIGGFNIAEHWLGNGVTHGWLDLGVGVEGPLAEELAASFDDLFERADVPHRPFCRLRRSTAKRVVPDVDWELLLSGPGRGVNPFLAALGRGLHDARCVQFITPYFLPSRRLRWRLTRIARRGGQVQLILPAQTDIWLSRLAAQSFYRRLLKAGVEIYEYQPQILHSKLYVVDDAAFVGSANFDPRSLRINYEVMVRFTNPEAVARAREVFKETLAHSRRVELAPWLAARTAWQQLQQHWAHFLLARLDPWLANWQYRTLRPAG